MNNLALATQAARTMSTLAAKAAALLPAGSAAQNAALAAQLRPMNYMRHAEFEAVLASLELKPGMRVLDASSPQWLTLYLAHTHPAVNFSYINIIDLELDAFRSIAQALKLNNLTYARGDLRALAYPDESFDLAISVSVIEHVYPEVGGDADAVKELQRVVKANGAVLLTVPYKAQRNVVYVDGTVYERAATGQNFYAREYDAGQFNQLVADGNMQLAQSLTIREQPGTLAIDALEWGWGRRHRAVKLGLRLMRRFETTINHSFDAPLARRYLRLENAGSGRLVNIFATLVRKTNETTP